jgi:hypothetical protein
MPWDHTSQPHTTVQVFRVNFEITREWLCQVYFVPRTSLLLPLYMRLCTYSANGFDRHDKGVTVLRILCFMHLSASSRSMRSSSSCCSSCTYTHHITLWVHVFYACMHVCIMCMYVWIYYGWVFSYCDLHLYMDANEWVWMWVCCEQCKHDINKSCLQYVCPSAQPQFARMCMAFEVLFSGFACMSANACEYEKHSFSSFYMRTYVRIHGKCTHAKACRVE